MGKRVSSCRGGVGGDGKAGGDSCAVAEVDVLHEGEGGGERGAVVVCGHQAERRRQPGLRGLHSSTLNLNLSCL
jgi:hypothetical protein